MNRLEKSRANFYRYRCRTLLLFLGFFLLVYVKVIIHTSVISNHQIKSQLIFSLFGGAFLPLFFTSFSHSFTLFLSLSSISFSPSHWHCASPITRHTFRAVSCTLRMCVQMVNSKKSTQMAGGNQAISSRLNYIQFDIFVRANAMYVFALWCKP